MTCTLSSSSTLVFAVVASLVTAGCHGNPVESTHPTAASISPSVQAKLAELEQATTPTNWALFSGQTPPPNYRTIHRSADRFDIGAFDQVRAFYHGLDAWHDAAENVDTPAGCDNQAVAADGRLCPSVVLPGKNLPVGDGQKLITLFNTLPAVPREVMCTPAPKLSFVYYQSGIPVGELSVDLGCPKWVSAPGLERTFPSTDVRNEVVGICKRAGLFWCDENDPESVQMWNLWRSKHLEDLPAPLNNPKYDKRRKPQPLPLVSNKAVADLTPTEKLVACVWNMQHVGLSRAPGRDHPTLQMEGVSGSLRGGALGVTECVRQFPTCKKAIGEVAACQNAAQKGDLWFVLPENAGCKPLAECVWGFQKDR